MCYKNKYNQLPMPVKNFSNLYEHKFINGSSNNTLVLLHGTGGNEDDLIPIAKQIDKRANILTIRGDVSEDGTLRFFKRFAFGIFDQQDIIERSHKMVNFLKEACSKYKFSLLKTTAIGFSNGANLIASVFFNNSDVLENAILFRVMIPYFYKEAPKLPGKRILMLAGKFDRFVTKDNTEQLYTMFEEAGSDTDLYWTNSDHMLVQEDVDYAKDWYKKFVL